MRINKTIMSIKLFCQVCTRPVKIIEVKVSGKTELKAKYRCGGRDCHTHINEITFTMTSGAVAHNTSKGKIEGNKIIFYQSDNPEIEYTE